MAHQLIYPSMHTENVLSGRFRVHAVIGDSMEPALRGGRDCALVSPVTSYSGEGIYLIETGLGVDLFRVTSTFDGAGGLCLSRKTNDIGLRASAESSSTRPSWALWSLTSNLVTSAFSGRWCNDGDY